MSEKIITIADMSLEALVEGLIETSGETEVTAYRVAIIINGVFETAGVEKRIPTQQMYVYTRNGLIARGKKGKASEIRYTKDEVKNFVVKYTSKHLAEFAIIVEEIDEVTEDDE